MLDDQANLAAEHVAFQLAHPGQVELIDQLLWMRCLSSSSEASLVSPFCRNGMRGEAWGRLFLP